MGVELECAGPRLAKGISLQVAKGIEYLASRRVAHRDLTVKTVW
jgi:serine/threonine protein kinase